MDIAAGRIEVDAAKTNSLDVEKDDQERALRPGQGSQSARIAVQDPAD